MSMVTSRTVILMLGVLGIWWCALGTAHSDQAPKHGKYALVVRDQSSGYVLRLYERKTERTIWQEQVLGYGTFENRTLGWSKDGRALALPVQRSHKPEESILIWREHHDLYFYPRNTKHDYELDLFVWSPDNRKVLYRSGSSGAGIVDLGELYCLDTEKRKNYRIDRRVHKMMWTGPRTVQYWQGDYDGTGKVGKTVMSNVRKRWVCPR
jgi:hypothetical protein